MNGKLVGALAGLAFGIVLFWMGPGEAFIVLLFTLIGWFIGKVLSGEVDVLAYVERLSKRQGRSDRR